MVAGHTAQVYLAAKRGERQPLERRPIVEHALPDRWMRTLGILAASLLIVKRCSCFRRCGGPRWRSRPPRCSPPPAWSYWQAHGLLGEITVSPRWASTRRTPKTGTNILLIGLDSRKDQDGNDLPDAVWRSCTPETPAWAATNTNTLIPASYRVDGRVIAFSIPRDDYVAVTGIEGYTHIKIKEAYGLTKAQTEDQLSNEGVTDAGELEERGREAGRSATLRAKCATSPASRSITSPRSTSPGSTTSPRASGCRGVPEACSPRRLLRRGLPGPAAKPWTVHSRWRSSGKRHGLKNGDLDRTHRQQAFLASVMHSLQDSGTFTDLDKFRSLMGVALQGHRAVPGLGRAATAAGGGPRRWRSAVPDASRLALRHRRRPGTSTSSIRLRPSARRSRPASTAHRRPPRPPARHPAPLRRASRWSIPATPPVWPRRPRPC